MSKKHCNTRLTPTHLSTDIVVTSLNFGAACFDKDLVIVSSLHYIIINYSCLLICVFLYGDPNPLTITLHFAYWYRMLQKLKYVTARCHVNPLAPELFF